jgi:hypothetical protein
MMMGRFLLVILSRFVLVRYHLLFLLPLDVVAIVVVANPSRKSTVRVWRIKFERQTILAYLACTLQSFKGPHSI